MFGSVQTDHKAICRFQYRKQTTNIYVFSFVKTHIPRTALCTIQYRQADHSQHCAQFSTDRQNADNILYISVLTERSQTKICIFQYRKTDHTQQCVQIFTERETTPNNF